MPEDASNATERKQERLALLHFGARLLPAIVREPERVRVFPSLAATGLKRLPSMLGSALGRKRVVLATPPEPDPSRRYPPPGAVPDPANPYPGRDPWTWQPGEESYEDRQARFLEICAARDPDGLLGGAARACLQVEGLVSSEIIAKYVNRLDGRLDCADFFAIHMIHALYINERTPFLDTDQATALKQALLRFKYWLDEPGDHDMIFFTENHQVLFHTVEFLAGQLFPAEIFTNNGMTGSWHQARARGPILEWMKRRAKWGYSEWASSEYFAEDLEALVLLAEFSDNAEITEKAMISVDILLLHVACDLFHGYFASTHGRAYEKEILTGWEFDMAPAVKLVWGTGTYGREGVMTALSLAASTRYRPPDAILRLGVEEPATFESHERSGILFADAEQFGLSYDRIGDAPAFWGMGAFTNRPVLDLFVRAADRWSLWNTPFFDVAKDVHQLIPRRGNLGTRFSGFDLEPDRILLDQVNKVTFRTPDYMLSTAQCYHPGGRGNQHHIWQATLSPDAIAFTTNPGSLDYAEWGAEGDTGNFAVGASGASGATIPSRRTPTYWAGQNRFPKAVQHRNLAIILYHVDPRRAIGERAVHPFTHAFFPKWAFNEVEEKDGWVFGRARSGYIALWSAVPAAWENPDDTFCHDLVAKGTCNAWICMLGNEKEHSSFEEFKKDVVLARKTCDLDTLSVSFDVPQLGAVEVAWRSPLRINGHAVTVRGYPRLSNQFCESSFGSGQYRVEDEQASFVLDFDAMTRDTTG
jgi:hypothetical protein